MKETLDHPIVCPTCEGCSVPDTSGLAPATKHSLNFAVAVAKLYKLLTTAEGVLRRWNGGPGKGC